MKTNNFLISVDRKLLYKKRLMYRSVAKAFLKKIKIYIEIILTSTSINILNVVDCAFLALIVYWQHFICFPNVDIPRKTDYVETVNNIEFNTVFKNEIFLYVEFLCRFSPKVNKLRKVRCNADPDEEQTHCFKEPTSPKQCALKCSIFGPFSFTGNIKMTSKKYENLTTADSAYNDHS